MLLLLPGVGAAQQVYKCVTPKETTYQSQPCVGTEPVKTWDAQVSPRTQRMPTPAESTAQVVQGRASPGRHRPAAHTGQSAQGHVIQAPRETGTDRCVAAKRHRDATLEAMGNRRNYASSRALDDAVYQACK